MTDLGRVFRRQRRLRGIKQSHAAELLGVSQSTISRWEAGGQAPSPEARRALERLTAAPVCADVGLKRLVEAASIPVHLVCDATHVLLAASPVRAARWRKPASELIGRSLWPFASPEIQAMESRLGELGWYDGGEALAFWTGANAPAVVPIAPGLTLWERIALSDGREARLVSTAPAPPAHARLVA